jgi:hypothetical protein
LTDESRGSTAPTLESRQNACFVVGKEALPKEVQDSVKSIQSSVTCGSGTTIDKVPDVTSGSATFSKIDFSKSSSSPLQFALDTFATPADPAKADLAALQDQLNVYLATEAGLRSVGGNLAIKVPKFFLAMQVSRVQTAQVCSMRSFFLLLLRPSPGFCNVCDKRRVADQGFE